MFAKKDYKHRKATILGFARFICDAVHLIGKLPNNCRLAVSRNVDGLFLITPQLLYYLMNFKDDTDWCDNSIFPFRTTQVELRDDETI
jgi:hypothetical protein